jgi:hypothetical protein
MFAPGRHGIDLPDWSRPLRTRQRRGARQRGRHTTGVLNDEFRTRRAIRRALTATVPVASLLALAACGTGTTPAAGSTQAAAPGSPGLTAARAALAKYSERPVTISATQPVGKAIPKGKKIDFILCGVQSRKDLADFFTEAAEELGWQVKQIATQGTPESGRAAYPQAVRTSRTPSSPPVSHAPSTPSSWPS